MNGLTLLALLALAIGIALAWRAGVASGRRAERASPAAVLRPAVTAAASPPSPAPPPSDSPRAEAGVPALPVTPSAPEACPRASPVTAVEQSRLVRSLVAENAALRTRLADAAAGEAHSSDLAEDRRRLFAQLAAARSETARYRTLVIDLENNAPPPLLDGPSPDDLKLIVGIGPVLERMLQQMGITSYRQIARWSERDIEDFDARLAEFPGRIRRDAWVTQARALHQSKYGEALPVRDR